MVGLGCFLACLITVAQDVAREMAKLYVDGKYVDIIHLRTRIENRDLTADECFFVGLAYFNLQEDEAALTFFEIASRLRHDDPDIQFHKALCLMYLTRHEEALETINKAVSIDAESPIYQTTKADIFYNLNQLDSALVFYKKAIAQPECEPRSYMMSAQIFEIKNKIPEAIEAYYLAKDNIDKTDAAYQNCLYNLGTLLYHQKLYNSAVSILWELLDIAPTDFEGTAKMIQVYYAKKDYEKGNDLKQKLYHAFENKELPAQLQDAFCFDQFMWQERKVMVFENYEEDRSAGLFYKHIFYVLDSIGNVDYTVQTEQSNAVLLADKAYVLGMDKNGKHATFSNYLFEENFHYDSLKTAVINILNGTVQPQTSSFQSESGTVIEVQPVNENDTIPVVPTISKSPKSKRKKGKGKQ